MQTSTFVSDIDSQFWMGSIHFGLFILSIALTGVSYSYKSNIWPKGGGGSVYSSMPETFVFKGDKQRKK